MRAVVIGATGNVGTSVVSALAAGAVCRDWSRAAVRHESETHHDQTGSGASGASFAHATA
jgi:uncharacterized protein YbjT (DUF2867 family)